MLFAEALDEMLKGNYVTRTVWDNTNEYCVLMPGMQYIWKILTSPTPNAGNHVLSVADLQADDWKAYEKGDHSGLAVGEYHPGITAPVV